MKIIKSISRGIYNLIFIFPGITMKLATLLFLVIQNYPHQAKEQTYITAYKCCKGNHVFVLNRVYESLITWINGTK